jgi:hypothetical protein
MTLVYIAKSWPNPDLRRQTPGNRCVWGNVSFTLDPVTRCDYLVVLNHVPAPMTIEVAPERVWAVMQEPPLPAYRCFEKGFVHYERVFTQDLRLRGRKFVHTHGSLPWHVARTYDELTAMTPPEKTRDLSWITSNLGVHKGHKLRLQFLERLKSAGVPFDLFGRGFKPLPDKWDGIAPYRYAIAVENNSCPHYWTEKIADCFLAWTMPIYFGATNISDYFPADSYVWVNVNDPAAPRQVAEIIKSDRAERNRDAVAEARRRILEDHNLFARLAALVTEDQKKSPQPIPRKLQLPYVPDHSVYYLTHTPMQRFWHKLRRKLGQLPS